MSLEFYKNKLEQAGVVFTKGLSKDEIKEAEKRYRFIFPPDLKEFLMFALPISKGWINWRDVDDTQTQYMMNWAFEGICFDIEHNSFWLDEWGVKPSSLADAFDIAKQKIDEAPKLIPICGHRFIPDTPSVSGNPVFSIYQTDIIYYGLDLWNYFENEFHYFFQTTNYNLKEPIRQIEFWSKFVYG